MRGDYDGFNKIIRCTQCQFLLALFFFFFPCSLMSIEKGAFGEVAGLASAESSEKQLSAASFAARPFANVSCFHSSHSISHTAFL
jgi:hypothetical protein